MIIKKRDRKSASRKKKGQSGREYGDGALQRSRRRDYDFLTGLPASAFVPSNPSQLSKSSPSGFSSIALLPLSESCANA